MSDDQTNHDTSAPASRAGAEPPTESPLDELLSDASGGEAGRGDSGPFFPIGFRGYDRDAVDEAMRQLAERTRRAADEAHQAKLRAEAMFAQQRAEHDAELEEAARRHAEEAGHLQEQLRAAAARAADAEAQVHALSSDFTADSDADEDADP